MTQLLTSLDAPLRTGVPVDVQVMLQATYPEQYAQNHGQLPFFVPKPWGHELITRATPTRVEKIIFVKAGERLSDQYHLEKDEASRLLYGEALLVEGPNALALGFAKLSEAEQREKYQAMLHEMTETRIHAGHTWHNEPGKMHTIQAVTDIAFYEVQTPELNDVVRLVDKYGRSGSKP